MKIVVSGSNIKVYVDGNLEIDYNDGIYTSGYFGFNVFGVKAHYDNLVIKDNTETYYIRGADGEVLAEYDLGDNLVAEYVYANGQRIVKRNPAGNVDIYLNDHLGSARAMVGNGWSANYYPFGEIASQTGSEEDTHFDFTGQERDHGTGLMYFGARYYDPVVGRFLTMDPLANVRPWESPYMYVGNNPLNNIDPTGEDWFYYQAAGDSVSRYHWHPGSEYTTTDAEGNETTLTAVTAGNVIVNENGAYYYLDTYGIRASAWQDDTLPFLWHWGGASPGSGFDVSATFKTVLLAEGGGHVLSSIFKAARSFFAARSSKWTYGGFKSSTKWANQLAKRGWTEKQITEAITRGKRFKAVNNVNPGNSATRYVHTETGQSIVIDDVTKELLHVGGPGFKY